MRTLESLYWLGVKINKSSDPSERVGTLNNFISQWEIYDLSGSITAKEALNSIIDFMETNSIKIIHASTQIIIVPGYKFRIVNNLITNFHQPKSTLLLLVAAFVGSDWKKIYNYALNNEFRFLSYGDSSFLSGL